jgi:Family of unknown function (DUF5317)
VLVYAIVVVVAALIPAVTRGSYTRLLDTKWRFRSVLFAGLAIQIALEYVTIPREHWHDVGFGLLVASYVMILAFAARHLVIRGMGIVVIGIACNALVIVLNQGMPFKVPAGAENKSWTQPTVKHHPQQPDDKLRFLSDIIVLRSPFESAFSFGDLILAVGLCDVAYNASRKPKRRPRAVRRPSKPRTVDLAQHEERERNDRRREPDPEHHDEQAEERPLVLNHSRAPEHADWFDAGWESEVRSPRR